MSLSVLVCAAQNIPVGSWRTHFSYQQALHLQQTDNKVFCSATNGMFSVDILLNEITRLSKLDGLSDVGISAMKYNADLNLLAIGYRSGLVDFVFEDRIETIRDITNANIDGDKQINDIAFSTGETFLATDLGIIVVDLNSMKIRENFTQIGTEGRKIAIKEIVLMDNTLFATTFSGIQSGSLSENLLDFNSWTRYPLTENFEYLSIANGSVYVVGGDVLFMLNNDTWQKTFYDLPQNTTRLFSKKNELYTTSPDTIYRFTDQGFVSIETISATHVNDIILVNDQFWIADDSLGLIDQNGKVLFPSGPLSDKFSRIKVSAGDTYGFHSPNAADYDGLQKRNGYSFFSAGTWAVQTIRGFQNVSDVGFYEGSRYFASIGDGLYDESTDKIVIDIPTSGTEMDTIISAITTNDENLWLSSYNSAQPICGLNENGWQVISENQTLFGQFTEIALSQTGILWLSGPFEGIVNFDPKEIQSQLITTEDRLLKTVTDIEISVNDDVWVGSASGLVTFADASFIFNLSDPIIPSFDNRQLFADEEINAVETDGGNRVWLATNRGLWLFDENLNEQVAVFTTDNSPLPSNTVLDLAYNGLNGELFILTEKGLVSYRSASSVGARISSAGDYFSKSCRTRIPRTGGY